MTLPRVGLNLPQDAGPEASGAAVARYARRLEELGFHSAWVSDSQRPDILEPLTVLTAAAMSTARIELGTAVLLSAHRSPRGLARQVATLDRLSGGRLALGVGLGNDPDEYARHGIRPAGRGPHFTAHVEVLRKLLEQERITSRTPWWRLVDEPRQVAPAQIPGPPLLLGANRGAALRRAATLGDGWIAAGSAPLDGFEETLARVRRHVRAAGRDPGSFRIVKRLYLHVGGSGSLPRIRMWFAHHYGRADLADAVVVLGGPQRCAEEITRLARAGVDDVVLHPVVELAEQAELIARDVLPRLETESGAG